MLGSFLRSRRRRAAVAGIAAAAGVGLAVPASAGLLGDGDDLDRLMDHLGGTCETALKVPAELLPDRLDLSVCDLRGTLVEAGSLAVRVPHVEGTGASAASVVTEDAPAGTVTELSVVNTGETVLVDVLRLGEEPAPERSAPREAATSPTAGSNPSDVAAVPPPPDRPGAAQRQGSWRAASSACTVGAHAYTGTRNDGMNWKLDVASIPSYLSSGLTTAAILDGADRLARGANDCGLDRMTGIDQDYQGQASKHANCAGPDGQSIVGFGGRPSETLGTTCWWYAIEDDTHRVFEADVVFQDDQGTFYFTEPLRCEGRYALSGVATHEFGHAFGLAHVNEQRFPDQTMSPTAPTCSYDQSSLGRGDWLGLHGLYGG